MVALGQLSQRAGVRLYSAAAVACPRGVWRALEWFGWRRGGAGHALGCGGWARVAAAMIAIVTAGPCDRPPNLRIEFKELAAIAQQALGGATLALA